jgi:cytidylate kinase
MGQKRREVMSGTGERTLTVVTVSGLPGSGTSTACRLLQRELGYRWVNTGQLFREMARERGMDLNSFGAYAREHQEVDQELDRRQLELASGGEVILEGRLSGQVLKRGGAVGLAVWVEAPEEVRLERVSGRDGLSIEVARETTLTRERLERERYLEIYGIDLNDLSIYDLVLDSARLSPSEIVDAVVAALRR